MGSAAHRAGCDPALLETVVRGTGRRRLEHRLSAPITAAPVRRLATDLLTVRIDPD